MVSYRRLLVLVLLLFVGAAVRRTQPVSAGDEWQPISQEELKMTSEPKAPGAPAIILYHQVDRDDSAGRTPHEFDYVREKIFTEEGRKYADVEIPFMKNVESIHSIKARTIRPDGTIVNFDGKIYEKEIVKARGFKYLAKTFTLSDVQPGSVIEYHYSTDFPEYRIYDSHWTLSEELFTKRGKYSLKPYVEFALQWSWPNGLPEGTAPPTNKPGDAIRLEAQNIPAFQAEDDMPPEDTMKFRVDFVYSDDGYEKDPEKFWKKRGKKLNDGVESFVGKRKAMEQAVAEIVSASDSPETKLQKIYARVQRVRNTSYEQEKTEQEQKRAKEKEINNVEDVWKRGYADGNQIPWLYLGLARAAGFDASPVRVSTRDTHFFSANIMRADDLNSNIVVVKLNGKDLYLDPGTAFVPFGLLPWSETGVRGLKLDKDGGTWVTTPVPESTVSQIERKADLKLSNEGSLEGKLTITYSGLEALWRRIGERHEDEAHRKKFLEDDVKEAIPVVTEVELISKPDWASSAPTLVAEFDLKVPGWVSGAGRRALLPVGLFSAPEKHAYEHTTRVHPLYFHFMSQKIDDVRIELPLGWQVDTVPQPQTTDAKLILYTLKVENDKGTLRLERRLKVDLINLEQKYYPDPGNIVGYEIDQEVRPYVLQDVWEFQEVNVPVREARYTLQLPPGWEYKAAWLNHAAVTPTSGGANQWQWVLSDVGAIKPEYSMPPRAGVVGQMIVSLLPQGGGQNKGFVDWNDMGRWEDRLAQGRRDASAEIKQKVTALTGSASTSLAKMRVLAQFVQKDIRYVAIQLGIGGWQPHPAAEIFVHHYGDCKDKATLMSSMLKEIGVESYYLSVNTTRGIITPETPATRWFDHEILAVRLPEDVKDPSLIAVLEHPKLGRLLIFDPTDEWTPYGQLRGPLQSNYALLVTPDGGELIKLPQLPTSMNGVERTAKLKLDSAGTLSGEFVEQRNGDYATYQRAALKSMSKDADRIKPIETMLSHSLPNFQITKASILNLNLMDQPFQYLYSLVAEKYARPTGTLLFVRPRIVGFNSSDLLETKEPRKFPVEFDGPVKNTDTFEIALPAGYEVDDLPPPVNADYSFASYHSKTEVNGNTLKYTRTFEVKELSVPLSKVEDLKKLYRVIAGDERNTAVLKPATH